MSTHLRVNQAQVKQAPSIDTQLFASPLRRWLSRSLVALGSALLLACGGGNSPPPAGAPVPPPVSAVIGAAGGTLTGPDGVQVIVPPAALAQATEFVVTRDGAGAPELGGLKLISPIYAVTPHGTEFAESARISIPFNPADVAPGTQPVIIKSQPGGSWTALVGEVAGNTLVADTSGLSYYAVGTCVLSTSVSVPGPDPLLACPSQHSMKLELLDASGLALPTMRNSSGLSIPVLTITAPTQLKVRFSYSRPPSNRLDHITLTTYGATFGAMTPNGWPNNQPLGGPSSSPVLAGYQMQDTFEVNPSTVPLGSQAGGTRLRFFARVETQVDAFFPGCACFKPASWGYEAEIAVRVIFASAPVVTHTVGGTVSGLTGAGLVLRNNGGNNLAVAANASGFVFPIPVNAGSAYNVTVLTQPAGQTCSVANGTGIASGNVGTVTVSCVVAPPPAPTATGPLSSMGGHTCAVKADFTVACWGGNGNYALGDGTAINRSFPVAVTGLTGVESVSVGTTHSCALKSDKTVWCWGANDFGQIGLSAAGAFPAPTQVAGLSGVAALSAGRTHNCVLKTDGTVACWGRNNLGQLGDGTTTDSFAPVVVSGLSGVSMLNSGWDRTCAVTGGGGVVCWGDLNYSLVGGLPVATVAPQAVAGLTGAVSVSSGGNYHACALKSDNSVACWGNNGDGALGNGTNVGGLTAVTVSGLTDAAKVSTASGHTCAIRTNGSVMCWGNNSRGQLGDNTTTPKNVPVSVVGLTGAAAIATGAAFSCVLKTDGSAACWGYNLEGYLGDLSTVEKHVPSAVFGGAVFWK